MLERYCKTSSKGSDIVNGLYRYLEHCFNRESFELQLACIYFTYRAIASYSR